MEWRRGDPRTSVDAKGVGLKCFKVRPADSGHFVVTGVTAAAHGTEHNDLWLWSSAPVYYVRGGKRRGPVEQTYFKAYQNEGPGNVATMLYAVNHQPHFLVTGLLEGGRTYRLCMAGRSSRFVVYALALVRCDGLDECRPGNVRFGSRVDEGIVSSTCAV